MRSYAWALSGDDFTAKLDLFGDAKTEEDIDALADYIDLTIKALKRSLKVRQQEPEWHKKADEYLADHDK